VSIIEELPTSFLIGAKNDKGVTLQLSVRPYGISASATSRTIKGWRCTRSGADGFWQPNMQGQHVSVLGKCGPPYWIKLQEAECVHPVRFLDGLNWGTAGDQPDVTMARTCCGSGVSNRRPCFGHRESMVSVSSAAAPASVITAVSAPRGHRQPGGDFRFWFWSFARTSAVLLMATVTINTWSSTSISITIPVEHLRALLVPSLRA